MALNDLATLYSQVGRTAESESLFGRALAIREEALGPDHPDVAETLEDYAELLRQLGRSEEADSLAARAESIRAAAGN